jgi:hypothetical protein
MGWGKWGSTMFFLSLSLILGSREAWWKGGLSMGFFSLSLIMGGATMGEHGHIYIF